MASSIPVGAGIYSCASLLFRVSAVSLAPYVRRDVHGGRIASGADFMGVGRGVSSSPGGNLRKAYEKCRHRNRFLKPPTAPVRCPTLGQSSRAWLSSQVLWLPVGHRRFAKCRGGAQLLSGLGRGVRARRGWVDDFVDHGVGDGWRVLLGQAHRDNQGQRFHAARAC